MFESYSTEVFESAYTYTGSDLGVAWTPYRTVFRLWAPTAQRVLVNFYQSGTPGADDRIVQMPMRPDVNGTWILSVDEETEGLYYTYEVTVNHKTVEVCDPYARAVGVNGERALILNLRSTDPEGWDKDADPNAGKPITDAIIYELHIRDLSMGAQSGIVHKGKYLGLAENGTKNRIGLPTGLDHIKALGVTHIHLLPVYDFGSVNEWDAQSSQYNWGYDPVNYNVPEGSYATDAHRGEVRVAEMKSMVQTLHRNGISVIMDVVYNHVYHTFGFCINQIVPGYFSRISPDGKCSAGSGCGNDTASERSMVRKYIVDSVCYWADEYHIDGFRFDLIGLLDVRTVQEIMDAVHQKHPNVLFYGEGWSIPTSVTKPDVLLATQYNAWALPKMAYFNDTIRDAMRGSVFDHHQWGFVSGAAIDKQLLEKCFTGAPDWASAPTQSINYISCHDDLTLADRIAVCRPDLSASELARRCRLAAAFNILSQGVPFLMAGEEMLRSKPMANGSFCSNSYRSSDRINSLKWKQLGDPEVWQTTLYYRGLIALRKEHSAFRYRTQAEIHARISQLPCDDAQTAVFLIHDEQETLIAIFNASDHDVNLCLPNGSWSVLVKGNIAGVESLGILHASAAVERLSTMVLVCESCHAIQK